MIEGASTPHDTHAQSGAASARAGEAATQSRPDEGRPDELWDAFLEPSSRAQYLGAWLAIACRRIPDASHAVLFVRADAGRLGVGASWGGDTQEQETFERIAGDVAGRGEPVVHAAIDGAILGYPIRVDAAVQAVIVVHLSRHPGRGLRDVFRELHWACGWIEAQLWRARSALGTRQTGAARLAIELLAAADSHERFDAAAMAVVNAMTELTGFDRAALGMAGRKAIRLEALSRAAAFKRRAEFVSEFETAMEEAVAQDQPIALPRPKSAPSSIDLAHRALIHRTGDGVVLTVPLPVRGRAVGAVTVTRRRGDDEIVELDPDAIEEMRLAVAAVAPVLKLKHDERRWWSGRLRNLAGRAATALLGRRPALALGFAAGAILLALPFFMSGEFRINARAALQGSQQRAAVALLDGFLLDSRVRAGDLVREGDVLALLDDRDLKLEESRLRASVARAEQAIRDALASGDRAASARASAELAEARASLGLVAQQLERLTIAAPVSGVVVSGDLSQRLGAPVSRGEVLFEIARLDGYRVMADVSEYDLAYIEPGQSGEIVLASLPDRAIAFRVAGIARVSDPAGGENRFRVEADVTGEAGGVRPGMEGVAKIGAGRARLAWIWTRGTMDRLRVFVWRFLP